MKHLTVGRCSENKRDGRVVSQSSHNSRQEVQGRVHSLGHDHAEYQCPDLPRLATNMESERKNYLEIRHGEKEAADGADLFVGFTEPGFLLDTPDCEVALDRFE